MGFRRKKRVNREKLGQFIAQAVTMADVLYPTDSRDEKKQWVIDLVNSHSPLRQTLLGYWQAALVYSFQSLEPPHRETQTR